VRLVQRIGLVLSLVPIFLVSGCNGFFTSGDSIASITISPTSRLAASGKTITFTANGTTVNGAAKDVTSTATWKTTNSAVATVSAGAVTTVSAGTASITATQDSETGTANLIVTASTLSSIGLSPSSPSVLQTQLTQQFMATGTFADSSTKDLTSIVQWTSSSTNVATINSSGVATLIASGQTTITATVTTDSGVVTGTTTLTVQ